MHFLVKGHMTWCCIPGHLVRETGYVSEERHVDHSVMHGTVPHKEFSDPRRGLLAKWRFSDLDEWTVFLVFTRKIYKVQNQMPIRIF